VAIVDLAHINARLLLIGICRWVDLKPGWLAGLGRYQESGGGWEESYPTTCIEWREMMSKEGDVGIRPISESMQPEEGVLGLLIGESHRPIDGISQKLGDLRSSHLIL
jgi:hypothetical protein